MRKPSFRLVLIPGALGAILWLTTCAPAATPTRAPTPVTVQLKWLHQAQFAGFYAADLNGDYAAEGLAITFVEGGPTVSPQTAVLNGMAQFGVTGADELILARADGKPVRALATLYRRSPLVFVARADSGLSRPEDFVGKKVLVAVPVIPTLHAMMARVGIPREQYTAVTLPYDVALFASGEVPVWAVYLTGSIQILEQAGYKLNIIYPDDYGVHFYADTIFATDDLIANNPDLALRFLRATFKGWTFAVENPAAMGQMVLKYKPDADAALENAKMTASLPLVNTGEDYIGWMKPEMWAEMEKTLREQGVLTAPLDVTQVYTMRFVKEIYGK